MLTFAGENTFLRVKVMVESTFLYVCIKNILSFPVLNRRKPRTISPASNSILVLFPTGFCSFSQQLTGIFPGSFLVTFLRVFLYLSWQLSGLFADGFLFLSFSNCLLLTFLTAFWSLSWQFCGRLPDSFLIPFYQRAGRLLETFRLFHSVF